MYNSISKRYLSPPASRTFVAGVRGNAGDSPQRISNWLLQIPPPRPPTPPPQPPTVSPVKTQSPIRDAAPVPEPRTPPFALPRHWSEQLRELRRRELAPFHSRPAQPFRRSRLGMDTPFARDGPTEPIQNPEPVKPSPSPESTVPASDVRVVQYSDTITHIFSHYPRPGFSRRRIRKTSEEELYIKVVYKKGARHPFDKPAAVPPPQTSQPSEPVKPSPIAEPVHDLPPVEEPEEFLPPQDSDEPSSTPDNTRESLPEEEIDQERDDVRIVYRFAVQSPQLTTTTERTEQTRSMATTSSVVTETDNTGVSAPSPCEGLSLNSAAFSQSSADSFEQATLDRDSFNGARATDNFSLPSPPRQVTDPFLDTAAFSQAPAVPADSAAPCQAEDDEERAHVEAILGQRVEDHCADAIAALPVRDEMDETSLITGYSSPQMEPLPESAQEFLPAPSTEPLPPPQTELPPPRRQRRRISEVPQLGDSIDILELLAECRVIADRLAQSVTGEISASDSSETSLSLDDEFLPKVTLAAPPPPSSHANLFDDVMDNAAVLRAAIQRTATAPDPTTRQDLFADLHLREEHRLPAVATTVVGPSGLSGILGTITTKAVTLAKAAWAKVKNLVWG